MKYFCTLFDTGYLSRGLAMQKSLEETISEDYILYILAFDDDCLITLKKMNLDHTVILSLSEFEGDDLLKIKDGRTRGEYCWTCTPAIILYCIEKFGITHCTYLDADLFFYADPVVLLDEMSTDSVLITEHSYTPRYDQSSTSGRFCVQFLTVFATEDGFKTLKWWKEACLEWCFARHEDGKFGDQKYLDDWPERFKGIHILEHPGGGVAPWNVQSYELSRNNNDLELTKRGAGVRYPVVFYHFHDLKFLRKDRVDMGPYELSAEVKEFIYLPYIICMEKIHSSLQNDARLDKRWIAPPIRDIKGACRWLKRKIFDANNVHGIADLLKVEKL